MENQNSLPENHSPEKRRLPDRPFGISEEDFARFYVLLSDPREAALCAGAPEKRARDVGYKLLADKRVRAMIKRLRKRSDGDEVSTGLRRLAFGRVNDSLELLKEDGPEKSPDSLDLYNVSEIKRVKGGGVEIKFFSRLEALEKLSELKAREGEDQKADEMLRAFNSLGG